MDRLFRSVGAICAVSIFCLSMVLPATLRAQKSFGTILGTVTDSSEAAIPDVTVTVTNMRTGVTRQVRTDQYGNYTVPSLLPGYISSRPNDRAFSLPRSPVWNCR